MPGADRNLCEAATMFLKILSRTYKPSYVRLEYVYVRYMYICKYFYRVSKTKNIWASIRKLTTKYNERRLLARFSCQTGIQTQISFNVWEFIYRYTYAYVFVHINLLEKNELANWEIHALTHVRRACIKNFFLSLGVDTIQISLISFLFAFFALRFSETWVVYNAFGYMG